MASDDLGLLGRELYNAVENVEIEFFDAITKYVVRVGRWLHRAIGSNDEGGNRGQTKEA